MRKYHIVYDIWNTIESRLTDQLAIDQFLRYITTLCKAQVLHGPNTIKRKNGVTGFLVTEQSHISIHTFPQSRSAAVDIFSFDYFDRVVVYDYIKKYFQVDASSIKMVDVMSSPEDFIECEEPNCSRKAVREWEGRKVCQDHYDVYREYKNTYFDRNEYR
jgi:S-adenosylmethionine/arginine decarboxylase-like enzyme